MYGIRADYTENPVPAYYLDDVPGIRGVTFQPDVYGMAELLAEREEWWRSQRYAGDVPTVVDIGAGWGEKLAAMQEREPKWDYVGVDFDMNLTHCREAHPWAEWYEVDLETVDKLPIPWGAVVIFSDVIEHLKDPTAALSALLASEAAAIVLSTPERNVEHGYDHAGPSPNPCHVREWSAEELHNYLTDFGFTILHHGLTRGSDQGWAMGTQLVVMRP